MRKFPPESFGLREVVGVPCGASLGLSSPLWGVSSCGDLFEAKESRLVSPLGSCEPLRGSRA